MKLTAAKVYDEFGRLVTPSDKVRATIKYLIDLTEGENQPNISWLEGFISGLGNSGGLSEDDEDYLLGWVNNFRH